MSTADTQSWNGSDDGLVALGWTLHAAGLAVSLAICAAQFVGIVRPMIQEGRDVDIAIHTAEMYMTAASAIEARHHVAVSALTDELRLAEERAARIPDAARESELLAQLSELAHMSGMKILAYQPAGTYSAGSFHALAIELNGHGSYAGTCTFLAGLESLPRLCHVTRLNIVAPASVGADLQVDLTLQVYYGSPPDSTGLLASRSETADEESNVRAIRETSPLVRRPERSSSRDISIGSRRR